MGWEGPRGGRQEFEWGTERGGLQLRGSRILEGSRGGFPRDQRMPAPSCVLWVCGNPWEKWSCNFRCPCHLCAFAVLTEEAKGLWDSRAGEGEAGVAGLGGAWLEAGSKPHMKVQVLPQAGAGRNLSPGPGTATSGPPVPSPLVSWPGVQPWHLLVRLSEPCPRRNYVIFGAAITQSRLFSSHWDAAPRLFLSPV